MRNRFNAAYISCVFFLGPTAMAESESICRRLVSLGALSGVSQKEKSVKRVFGVDFPARNREFIAVEVQLNEWVPRPVGYHKRRLRYLLIDIAEKRVVWSFDDAFTHKPSRFLLSPVDRDAGAMVRDVESFYVREEAPRGARARPEFPGDLASVTLTEVVYLSPEGDGTPRFQDLGTTSDRSPQVSFAADGSLTVRDPASGSELKFNP